MFLVDGIQEESRSSVYAWNLSFFDWFDAQRNWILYEIRIQIILMFFPAYRI